jgi:hypothetical protein
MVPLWLGQELGGSSQECGTSVAENRVRGSLEEYGTSVAAGGGDFRRIMLVPLWLETEL